MLMLNLPSCCEFGLEGYVTLVSLSLILSLVQFSVQLLYTNFIIDRHAWLLVALGERFFFLWSKFFGGGGLVFYRFGVWIVG